MASQLTDEQVERYEREADEMEAAQEAALRAQGWTDADFQAQARHDEECYREMLEEQRTGRRMCPKCGQRSVRVDVKPTRNYGGGFDTFEECEHDGCDYADVHV